MMKYSQLRFFNKDGRPIQSRPICLIPVEVTIHRNGEYIVVNSDIGVITDNKGTSNDITVFNSGYNMPDDPYASDGSYRFKIVVEAIHGDKRVDISNQVNITFKKIQQSGTRNVILDNGSNIDHRKIDTDEVNGVTWGIESISVLNGGFIMDPENVSNKYIFSSMLVPVYPSTVNTFAIDLLDTSKGMVETQYIYILKDGGGPEGLVGLTAEDKKRLSITSEPFNNVYEEVIKMFNIDDNGDVVWFKDVHNLETFDNYINVIEGPTVPVPVCVNIGSVCDDAGVYEQIFNIFLEENGVKALYGQIVVNSEFIDEDVKYRTLLGNFGMFDPVEIERIFKEKDVNDDAINWTLINEKSKIAFIEHSNITPFLGTYKGLLNTIKWLGYDDITFKEWYRSHNTDVTNSNKSHTDFTYDISPDYEERLKIAKQSNKHSNISKLNRLTMVYKINDTTGENDYWGIPITKTVYAYNNTDVFVKLSMLRTWLKENIIGVGCDIVEISGEGVYFELYKSNIYATMNQERKFENELRVTPTFIESYSYLSPVIDGDTGKMEYKNDVSVTLKEFGNYRIDGYKNDTFGDITTRMYVYNEDKQLYEPSTVMVPGVVINSEGKTLLKTVSVSGTISNVYTDCDIQYQFFCENKFGSIIGDDVDGGYASAFTSTLLVDNGQFSFRDISAYESAFKTSYGEGRGEYNLFVDIQRGSLNSGDDSVSVNISDKKGIIRIKEGGVSKDVEVKGGSSVKMTLKNVDSSFVVRNTIISGIKTFVKGVVLTYIDVDNVYHTYDVVKECELLLSYADLVIRPKNKTLRIKNLNTKIVKFRNSVDDVMSSNVVTIIDAPRVPLFSFDPNTGNTIDNRIFSYNLPYVGKYTAIATVYNKFNNAFASTSVDTHDVALRVLSLDTYFKISDDNNKSTSLSSVDRLLETYTSGNYTYPGYVNTYDIHTGKTFNIESQPDIVSTTISATNGIEIGDVVTFENTQDYINECEEIGGGNIKLVVKSVSQKYSVNDVIHVIKNNLIMAANDDSMAVTIEKVTHNHTDCVLGRHNVELTIKNENGKVANFLKDVQNRKLFYYAVINESVVDVSPSSITVNDVVSNVPLLVTKGYNYSDGYVKEYVTQEGVKMCEIIKDTSLNNVDEDMMHYVTNEIAYSVDHTRLSSIVDNTFSVLNKQSTIRTMYVYFISRKDGNFVYNKVMLTHNEKSFTSNGTSKPFYIPHGYTHFVLHVVTAKGSSYAPGNDHNKRFPLLKPESNTFLKYPNAPATVIEEVESTDVTTLDSLNLVYHRYSIGDTISLNVCQGDEEKWGSTMRIIDQSVTIDEYTNETRYVTITDGFFPKTTLFPDGGVYPYTIRVRRPSVDYTKFKVRVSNITRVADPDILTDFVYKIEFGPDYKCRFVDGSYVFHKDNNVDKEWFNSLWVRDVTGEDRNKMVKLDSYMDKETTLLLTVNHIMPFMNRGGYEYDYKPSPKLPYQTTEWNIDVDGRVVAIKNDEVVVKIPPHTTHNISATVVDVYGNKQKVFNKTHFKILSNTVDIVLVNASYGPRIKAVIDDSIKKYDYCYIEYTDHAGKVDRVLLWTKYDRFSTFSIDIDSARIVDTKSVRMLVDCGGWMYSSNVIELTAE